MSKGGLVWGGLDRDGMSKASKDFEQQVRKVRGWNIGLGLGIGTVLLPSSAGVLFTSCKDRAMLQCSKLQASKNARPCYVHSKAERFVMLLSQWVADISVYVIFFQCFDKQFCQFLIREYSSNYP